MATGVAVNRITSKDIQVEYTPVGTEGSPTKVRLYIRSTPSGGVISGTFRLWVNGKLTDNITYNATPLTLATSVAAALNNANTLGAAAVTAADSPTEPGNIEVTLATNGFYRFEPVTTQDDGDNTLLNATLKIFVITQGTQTYRIDGEAVSFSYEDSVDMIDMTSISEFDNVSVPVKSSMTYELNIYEAVQTWGFIFYKGAGGILQVWETGKVTGSKYFSFNSIIDSYGKDFPDHEKVEISISGMRKGPMIIPLDTIYRV